MSFNNTELKQEIIQLLEQHNKEALLKDINTTNITFSIEEVLNMIKKDREKDWDMVICVTGYEGQGKSTLVTEICQRAKELLGYNYSIPSSEAEMMEAIKSDNIPIIVFDEAVNQMYAREFMSVRNKKMVKIFTMCRFKNKISFMLIPKINNLDLYFRRDRVYMWIHVIKRNDETNEGEAFVFIKDMMNFANPDPFFVEEIYYILRNFSITTYNDEVVRQFLIEKLFYTIPSFFGVMKYKISDEAKHLTKQYSNYLKNKNMEQLYDTYQYLDLREKIAQLNNKFKLAKENAQRFYELYNNKKLPPAQIRYYFSEEQQQEFIKCLNDIRLLHARNHSFKDITPKQRKIFDDDKDSI